MSAEGPCSTCSAQLLLVAGIVEAHEADGTPVRGPIAGHTLCPGSWRRPAAPAAPAPVAPADDTDATTCHLCSRPITSSDWAVSDPAGTLQHADCFHDEVDSAGRDRQQQLVSLGYATTCEAPGCSTPLLGKATGRPRRTCSTACRVRLHRHERVNGRPVTLGRTTAPPLVAVDCDTAAADKRLELLQTSLRRLAAEEQTARTWVIVPCGGEKLEHKAPAGELYVGSYHKATRRAAAAIAAPEQTLILSALHGLLQLEDEVAPYDLHMTSPDSVPARTVARQMRALGMNAPGTRVIVLAGKAYSGRIRAAVRELCSPTRPDLEPVRPGTVVVDLPLQDTRSMGDQLALIAAMARTGETCAADLRAIIRNGE